MAGLTQQASRLLVAVSVFLPSAGWGGDAVPPGYQAIAVEQGLPSAVLYAVALTESGQQLAATEEYRPWPWTLNVAGVGYHYPTRIKAWEALNHWLNQGTRSIDIGLMQINWRYHRERLGDPWQALDPYHNLRVGADILRACYRTERDWWASVGCYHAPGNPENADRYRRRVQSRWQRIVSAG